MALVLRSLKILSVPASLLKCFLSLNIRRGCCKSVSGRQSIHSSTNHFHSPEEVLSAIVFRRSGPRDLMYTR